MAGGSADDVLGTRLSPSECFRMVGAGALDLRSAEAQGMLGAAMLRSALV